jgi:hypothetical protein
MKATLAVKFSLLAISLFSAAWIVGCATTPPVDWNSRVGKYTYDQAVAEYGSPTVQSQSKDGTVVARWVNQQMAGGNLNTGLSYYGSAGFTAGQNTPPPNRSLVLQLTFDAGGKLTDWSKNY